MRFQNVERATSRFRLFDGDSNQVVTGQQFLYVSPFVGRLDDVGQNGIAVLKEIVEIYHNYGWRTEVLASSIRHPVHVIKAARAGAEVATTPSKVLGQLFDHPLTDKGLERFLSDWHKAGRK